MAGPNYPLISGCNRIGALLLIMMLGVLAALAGVWFYLTVSVAGYTVAALALAIGLCCAILHRRLFHPLRQLAAWAAVADTPAGIAGRAIRTGVAEIELIRAGINRLADETGRLRGLMELLAEHSSVGMALFDADLTILWINEAAAQLAGCTAGQLTGQSCRQNPEFRRRLCPDCESVESDAFQRDGSCQEREIEPGRFCRVVYTPIRSAGGALQALVATFHDITGRMSLEQRLRESDEKFLTLANHAGVAVAIAGETIVYCNESFATLLGYMPEELVDRRSLTELVHPDMSRYIRDYRERQLKQPGDTIHCEIDFRHKEGARVTLDCRGTLLTLAGERYTLLSGVDVTPLKQATQALACQTELHGVLYDVSRQLAAVAPGRLDRTLARVLQLLGSHFQADRVNLYRFEPETNMAVKTHAWQSSSAPPPGEAPVRIAGQDIPWCLGQMHAGHAVVLANREELAGIDPAERRILQDEGVVSLAMIPVGSGGGLRGFLGLDSIDRMRQWNSSEVRALAIVCDMIERTLQRQEEQASAVAGLARREPGQPVLRLGSRIAAAGPPPDAARFDWMKHEMLEPVNVITGFSELLARELVNAEHLEYIQQVRDSSRRLCGLINDVMDLSALEETGALPGKRWFALRQFIHQIEEVLRPAIESKGLLFSITVDDPVPDRIYGDPDRLRQCLLNLLRRALAVSGQGVIQCQVRAEMRHRIRFDICDSGPGLTHQERLDLFQWTGSAEQGKLDVVLSLSIARKLAQLLGGNLSVISIPGRGTSFTLTVCGLPDDQVEADREESSETAGGPRTAQ